MKSNLNFRACRSFLLALALTWPFAAHGTAADADPTALRLSIRFYDYAGVADSTLIRAFDEIERIYGQAGVRVVSMRCRPDMTMPVLDARCDGKAGPTTIIVRILPRQMAARAGTKKRVFGFAMTASKPGFGAIASVFHHKVEQLAREWGHHLGVVLGHVISHEVGHLLLGFTGHSRRGIMQMPWNDPQLDSAHKGSLVFTRRQAELMRADVEERARVERRSTSPGGVRVEVAAEKSRTGGS